MQVEFSKLEKGEKKQLTLKVNENFTMPATMIRGKENGKTVTMTAGLHSGEYPSITATINLAREIDPEKVQGNILFIHCINTSGFKNRTLDVVYEDKENLNRNFPGNENENRTMSDEIKLFLENEVIKNSDYLFDFHSGAKVEELTTCMFLPVDSEEGVIQKSKNVGESTNTEKIIISKNSKGFVGYSAKLGVPSLLMERGGFGRYDNSTVEEVIADQKLILQNLEVYDFGVKQSNSIKEYYTKNTYLSADVDGLWYPRFKSDEKVKKGDILGTVTDFFGNEIKRYFAEQDGVVFYYTVDLSVSVGEALYAYGSI